MYPNLPTNPHDDRCRLAAHGLRRSRRGRDRHGAGTRHPTPHACRPSLLRDDARAGGRLRKTWILESGDQLRPEAPPDETATQDEWAGSRTWWPTAMPWLSTASPIGMPALPATAGTRSPRRRRPDGTERLPGAGADERAIYDATIAAWDAKYTYNRSRPAATDAELETVIPTPNSPSYPDEHAVTAGAAATVLAYLFPDEADASVRWRPRPPNPGDGRRGLPE